MTEIYSLSIVAEYGMLKGCESIQSQSGTPSTHCMEAISIVGIASRFIALLWRIPISDTDSISAVVSYNFDAENHWLTKILRLVRRHVERLGSIWSMSDAHISLLESGTCSRTRRRELCRVRNSCLIARRCTESPWAAGARLLHSTYVCTCM